MKIKPWLAAILLFSMGIASASIATFLFYQQYKLEQTGLQTGGTVIAVTESKNSDGDITYTPIVRFKTKNGRVYEFQSKYYSNPPDYKVGDEVIVLYPPDKPADAIIKGAGQSFIIVFGSVGGIQILIGLFIAAKTFIATIHSE